jgi:predicted butyrate kinase (DUF1464 family)
MTISIGIDYTPGQWRVCSIESGRQAEFQLCTTARQMQTLVSQVCALYPEPTIVVSCQVATAFHGLATLTEAQIDHLAMHVWPASTCAEVKEVLQAVRSLSLRSYCAPSVEYLPTLPAYRRLLRPALGSASEVCAVVALLQHMREQEASWPEMNFFYINAGEGGTCVLVIQEGQIVNGIGQVQGSQRPAARASLEVPGSTEAEQAEAQAYQEGLRQDLTGLLALHQVEDVVVLGARSPALIEQLADVYQLYLFPHREPESTGNEAALGAALLAEGLEQEGSAAQVVKRLQIPQAGPHGQFLPHFSGA